VPQSSATVAASFTVLDVSGTGTQPQGTVAKAIEMCRKSLNMAKQQQAAPPLTSAPFAQRDMRQSERKFHQASREGQTHVPHINFHGAMAQGMGPVHIPAVQEACQNCISNAALRPTFESQCKVIASLEEELSRLRLQRDEQLAESAREHDKLMREIDNAQKQYREDVLSHSQQQKELQRLRTLMRFSQLKRDSDKLQETYQRVDALENELRKVMREGPRADAEELRRLRSLKQFVRSLRLENVPADLLPPLPESKQSEPAAVLQSDSDVSFSTITARMQQYLERRRRVQEAQENSARSPPGPTSQVPSVRNPPRDALQQFRIRPTTAPSRSKGVARSAVQA